MGYVKSKADFIQVVTSTAASWPDLTSLGETMATIPLMGDAKVYVKRFNLADCPKPVQVQPTSEPVPEHGGSTRPTSLPDQATAPVAHAVSVISHWAEAEACQHMARPLARSALMKAT